MTNQSPSRSPSVAATLTLSILALLLSLTLGALVLLRHNRPLPAPEPSTVQVPVETTRPAPISVVVPNGNPGSVLCMDGYTLSAGQADAAAEKIVATCAGESLTNAQLQIYYLNAIRTYQLENSPEGPDFSQPLEQQLCPLGDGTLSWQHYFLQQALKSWQTELMLLQAVQEPRPILEEAFKPNETDDLHGKYVAAELPVNDFLYSDQPCYKPNSMHQAYLDGLQEQLETLAKQQGYGSLADYADAVFGSAVSAQALVEAAENYNLGYMLFTENSYEITVTEEEVDAYLAAHAQELPGEDSYSVDIRHVLLIPAGATIAEDGTVRASLQQWRDCEKQAESLLQSWSQEYLNSLGKEYNFARLANRESMDAGSKVNGGLYQSILPGQLISQLDEWCFDPERQVEDTAIIRSRLGYHIVFFCGTNSTARTAAREAVMEAKELEQWEMRRQENPLKVDYSAVALWADCSRQVVSAVDVLYPDIAHERFPEAIVYFQQDYMYSPYGGSYVGRGGCGITTMAMLATYMTDTIYTPDMLAARYPNYHDASGTKGELFRYVPAELGFFLDKTTSNIEEVIEALENGQRVVSLQHLGHFTSGGHYLLLQQYYPDSDTFQVRDSNIYNYGRLEGHKVDYFTRANILSGSATFYIMQNKITRIPACSRCGDGQSAPEKLLNEDYLCEKCTAALSRRNTFLTLMAE
ncbi:MAG: C39 family peptidase [Faecousia sp.]